MVLLAFYSLTLHMIYFMKKKFNATKQSIILASKSQLDDFCCWVYFSKLLGMQEIECKTVFIITRHRNVHTSSGRTSTQHKFSSSSVVPSKGQMWPRLVGMPLAPATPQLAGKNQQSPSVLSRSSLDLKGSGCSSSSVVSVPASPPWGQLPHSA